MRDLLIWEPKHSPLVIQSTFFGIHHISSYELITGRPACLEIYLQCLILPCHILTWQKITTNLYTITLYHQWVVFLHCLQWNFVYSKRKLMESHWQRLHQLSFTHSNEVAGSQSLGLYLQLMKQFRITYNRKANPIADFKLKILGIL